MSFCTLLFVTTSSKQCISVLFRLAYSAVLNRSAILVKINLN